MEDRIAYLMVLELRERLIASLVLFAGLRPGEVLGLKVGDHEGQRIDIGRRVYKGSVGFPKNELSERPVGLGPMVFGLLRQWKERLFHTRPDSWLLPSENVATPMAKDNCWRRYMKPRLETVQVTLRLSPGKAGGFSS